MHTLSPGARIGEYVLDAFLGRGGFGEVWSADHHELPDRRVAIKVPHSPDSVAMLRREGKVLATLDHPGIARVLGIDTTHEPPYCVIELIEGGSLADRLESEGPLAPDVARDVIVELLGVLEYAHERGIIHRDIKPENVLVTTEGSLRLTDFGFAHSLTGVSMQLSTSLAPSVASFAGTIAYVAPEVRDGEETIDGRADLYSLGILFFELLTGRRPAGPEVPSELRDELPEWCDRVFRRLCARRDRRFPSAARAREAIIHVSASEPPPSSSDDAIEDAAPTPPANSTDLHPTPRVILSPRDPDTQRSAPSDLPSFTVAPPPPPKTPPPVPTAESTADTPDHPPSPFGLPIVSDPEGLRELAIEVLSGPKVIEVRHAPDIDDVSHREGNAGEIDPTRLALLGRISESQLGFLRRELVAPIGSRVFYIQRATVDWLEELGIDDELRRILRDGLADDAGFDLLWHDPLDTIAPDDETYWGPARSA